MVGASLTGLTVIVNEFELVDAAGSGIPLSVTFKTILAVPDILRAGVKVAVQFGYVPPIIKSDPITAGIKAALEVDATLMLALEQLMLGDESISPMVKFKVTAVSSLVVALAIVEIVGASLTAFTVRTNVLDAVASPSETVKVIVEVPLALATGVRVTVQFGAVPVTAIPELAMTEELEELPVTEVPHTKVLSISLIVSAIPVLEISSGVT